MGRKLSSVKIRVFQAAGVWHVEMKRGIASEIYHANSKPSANALAKQLRKLNE